MPWVIGPPFGPQLSYGPAQKIFWPGGAATHNALATKAFVSPTKCIVWSVDLSLLTTHSQITTAYPHQRIKTPIWNSHSLHLFNSTHDRQRDRVSHGKLEAPKLSDLPWRQQLSPSSSHFWLTPQTHLSSSLSPLFLALKWYFSSPTFLVFLTSNKINRTFFLIIFSFVIFRLWAVKLHLGFLCFIIFRTIEKNNFALSD